MKMMLTGASGFIGECVLDELLRRKHHLIALVRSAVPPRWSGLENLEVMRADLLQAGVLDLRDKGIEVVVHLAAVTRQSASQQFADTVTGTSNLLSAVRQAGISRIVAISSTAVLDFRSMQAMALIDEHAPSADGATRCDYATSKLRQEQLLAEFAAEGDNACMILRPGLVYDESRLTAAFAGVCSGAVALLASHRGEVPTIEIRRLATAMANAAERELARWEVIHLVDDSLPSQSGYLAALRRRGQLPRVRIRLPWRVLQGLCYLAGALLAALGRRDKLPEVLLPQGFSRRLKPFRYSNAKAKKLLGWIPGHEFA
jgi:2-alkyl-3-oxoalkanoate reductase